MYCYNCSEDSNEDTKTTSTTCAQSTATANANHSLEEKQMSGRDYTYSELGRLMKKLEELSI